ncbi:hypothetical protein [Methanoplanus limicola]|jgi:hypothetical protein|uniref:Uncharacterized protein n=1 Tax=Methanoplanus limicola DSM 2279 TaxID=937775 RepID=H1Z2S5_9EURY|nr:hypothetical protein [Methanoplanus limicola]EHQ36478.1 hypothetical protein Metlim_2429 [Methanoplanus limicola DSM 2279]
MPRALTKKDISILKKIAPESEGLICKGSGSPYRSILPPLANHYSKDLEDFLKRLEVLDDDEIHYLIGLIYDGSESLGCIPAEYMEGFLNFISERIGEESADSVMKCFEETTACETYFI